MRKATFIFLVSVFALYLPTLSFAQGAYLRVGGGYGIGGGKGSVNSYFQREIMVNVLGKKIFNQDMMNFSKLKGEAAQVEFVKESFGKGVSFGLAGGYMFSKHLGIEAEFAYFMGSEIKSGWNLPESFVALSDVKKAKTFLIIPSLVISTGNKTLAPYARLGVVVGIAPKIISNQLFDDQASLIITNVEEKLTKGVAVGFSTAFGINYMLSDNFSLFTELKYVMLSYTPKQREITKILVKGEEKPADYLYDFPVQKLEDLTPENSGFVLDASAQNAFSYPLGSFSLNLGLRINFAQSGGLARSR